MYMNTYNIKNKMVKQSYMARRDNLDKRWKELSLFV